MTESEDYFAPRTWDRSKNTPEMNAFIDSVLDQMPPENLAPADYYAEHMGRIELLETRQQKDRYDASWYWE